MNQVSSYISSSFESISKNLEQVGKSAVSAGKALSTYVTLPLVGVSVAALKVLAT
jgi:hypothetical protein